MSGDFVFYGNAGNAGKVLYLMGTVGLMPAKGIMKNGTINFNSKYDGHLLHFMPHFLTHQDEMSSIKKSDLISPLLGEVFCGTSVATAQLSFAWMVAQ